MTSSYKQNRLFTLLLLDSFLTHGMTLLSYFSPAHFLILLSESLYMNPDLRCPEYSIYYALHSRLCFLHLDMKHCLWISWKSWVRQWIQRCHDEIAIYWCFRVLSSREVVLQIWPFTILLFFHICITFANCRADSCYLDKIWSVSVLITELITAQLRTYLSRNFCSRVGSICGETSRQVDFFGWWHWWYS